MTLTNPPAPFLFTHGTWRLLAWNGAAHVPISTLEALDLLDDLRLEASPFSLARADVLARALAEKRAVIANDPRERTT